MIIEHTFCINLERRSDRWQLMLNKFKRLNMQVERVNAVDGNNLDYKEAQPLSRFEYGCSLSHKKCFEIAKERGYKNFLLLEDDLCFEPNFNTRLTKALKDIPEDWDMIYLGLLLEKHWWSTGGLDFTEPNFTQIKNNIWKSHGCTGGHAIIFKDTMYDCINSHSLAVDVVYGVTHKTKNAYAIIPNLIGQRADYSDIKKLFDFKRIHITNE